MPLIFHCCGFVSPDRVCHLSESRRLGCHCLFDSLYLRPCDSSSRSCFLRDIWGGVPRHLQWQTYCCEEYWSHGYLPLHASSLASYLLLAPFLHHISLALKEILFCNRRARHRLNANLEEQFTKVFLYANACIRTSCNTSPAHAIAKRKNSKTHTAH